MEHLPLSISLVFIFTALAGVWLFVKATGYSRSTIILLAAWLSIQSLLSLSGFYTATTSTPPHFLLLTMPPLLLTIRLFVTRGGRQYIDRLDLRTLALLHIVRIPVELVLYWLSLQKVVPELMTFAGSNWDILSGLSAPVVYYIVFVQKKGQRILLLIWNITCMLLLLNIVVRAILSAPFPFQQFAFEQPNVAILYFPFALLPGCLVPLVLLSHLAALRQIVRDWQRNRLPAGQPA